MTHTAVGLFKNSSIAEGAVNDLKSAGVAAEDLRVLAEPRYMHVAGVLSTPEVDFCADLVQNLKAMGATEDEAQAYVKGVRAGEVLVFATVAAEQVDKCAEIMNQHQGENVEELVGADVVQEMAHESAIPIHGYSAQAGRVRHAGGGARIFAW